MDHRKNWLTEMERKRRAGEPSPQNEIAELERLATEAAQMLSSAEGLALRELSAGWRELVLAGYVLAAAYTSRTGNGVEELLGHAPEGAVWRAENLRLTRAAEQMADVAPDVLPLSDRWDDLATLALVLGQRQ